jgi:hypothetical protein
VTIESHISDAALISLGIATGAFLGAAAYGGLGAFYGAMAGAYVTASAMPQ